MDKGLENRYLANAPNANSYQLDAAYLAALLEEYYPDKAGKQLGLGFAERSTALVAQLGQVESEQDFLVAIQKYLAALDDGHTQIAVPLYEEGDPFYSLAIYPESINSWRIMALDSSFDQRALGGRLKSVNNFPFDSILAAVRKFHSSENDFYKLERFRRSEQLPAYWRALGLSTTDTLILEIIDSAGNTIIDRLIARKDVAVKAVDTDTIKYPFSRRQPTAFFTQYLPQFDAAYLQMNTSLDWVAMRPEINSYVAWPFSIGAKAVMRKRKRKEGAEDFGKVLHSFFMRVQKDSLERVIIDLRYNPGGDERLGLQLLYYLPDREDLIGGETYYRLDDFLKTVVKGDYKKYQAAFAKTHGRKASPEEWVAIDRDVLHQGFWQGVKTGSKQFTLDASIPKFDGEVFVLIGPNTFSAASILAATMQDNDLATIIGEPSGNRPSGPTGATRVQLPHSKHVFSLSYIYVERADTSLQHLDAVYPDVYAPRTAASIVRGGDPALEAALGLD